MNRRRMMMMSSPRMRHELEINEAGLIVTIEVKANAGLINRNFTKVYNGMAIASMIVYANKWLTILLVSEIPEAVTYSAQGSGSGTFPYKDTINYDNKTWYVSALEYGMDFTAGAHAINNPYNLPILNDISGREYAKAEPAIAAKDLLNYYYGKL